MCTVCSVENVKNLQVIFHWYINIITEKYPKTMKLGQKLRSLILVTVSGTGVFGCVCIYKGNEKFYKNVLMPAVHMLDPELTHEIGVTATKYNLFPKCTYKDTPILGVNIFGKRFSNPVGIAAGFDKQAEAVEGLHNIGFGFVEIGSVTPEPQDGNPKPRVFRLPEDLAVINRYGFNSDGHDKVYSRLESLKQSGFRGIIGVNLGKNKMSSNAIDDYVRGIKKLGPVADYIVINISSPNTPGLRALQTKEILENLLSSVIQARNSLPERPAVLVKLAPELSSDERRAVAEVVQRADCRVDGLVVCNTTLDRAGLHGVSATETGGLSGRPLAHAATIMIAEMYNLTNGIPIIGVGGIFSGADAYEKIKAGASLIQVYTALVYNGPPCAAQIKRELAKLLAADGYTHISQAVGIESNLYKNQSHT